MSQPCFITGWWWLEPWWLFFMTGTRNSWDEWIIVVVHRFSWIFPETVGNVIIPTDFHSIIFFGVDRLKPPTRSTSSMVAGYVPCLIGRCRLIAVTARPGFHHWHHPMNQPLHHRQSFSARRKHGRQRWWRIGQLKWLRSMEQDLDSFTHIQLE